MLLNLDLEAYKIKMNSDVNDDAEIDMMINDLKKKINIINVE